jgi:branched-chain amino acid aminotransferase
MSNVQFFAITPEGPQSLPIPRSAQTIHDLLDGLKLGVYTSLCTFEHNKFLYLEAHLERLQKSVDLMGWDYPLDKPLIRQAIQQVCTAYPQPDSRVRLDVLAEAPPVEHGNNTSRLTIALSPFPPYPQEIYTQGVQVGLVDKLRRSQPLIKDARFVIERRPFQSEKYHEQILVDADGSLLEGLTSNFYGVRDGILYTAPEGILEGIAQRIILQQAELLGIPVRRQAVNIKDIPLLDEAALSSSSRAIVPIVKIDEQTIGTGHPGPITTQILTAYRTFLSKEIRPAYPDL